MAAAKAWVLGLVATTLLLFCGWGWGEHKKLKAEAAAWDLATKTQVQLSASTAARLATTTLERDSLSALVKAAKQLGGTLVAGATITVQKHDTTIVHDTLATSLGADSTRTAQFRDSTFAGVVSGVVTAPKCCAPLSLNLSVERPAFRPQVGFVQVGQHLAVVVDWQGEHLSIDNAFALPLPEKPKRITPWAEGTYGVLTSSEVRAGIDLRLFGLRIGPSVEQVLAAGNAPRLGITVRHEW